LDEVRPCPFPLHRCSSCAQVERSLCISAVGRLVGKVQVERCRSSRSEKGGVYLVSSRRKVIKSFLGDSCQHTRVHLVVDHSAIPVLALLQATECHLCAWDILLWVLKVLKLSPRQRSISCIPFANVNSPMCPGSTQCPFACWHPNN
jgi:hypothetical protein